MKMLVFMGTEAVKNPLSNTTTMRSPDWLIHEAESVEEAVQRCEPRHGQVYRVHVLPDEPVVVSVTQPPRPPVELQRLA